MKKLVISTALVLSLGLAGCSEKTTNEDAQKDETSLVENPLITDSKITKEKYKQIKYGMTSEEVFNIIGSKGTIVSKNEAQEDSPSTDIYLFKTDNESSVAEMTFVDNKLSYKAQKGLETSTMEIDSEQLNKFEKGMTKEKVFETLGGKGALIAESDVLEIYSYHNSTSDTDVTLVFIEGKFKSSGELQVSS